VAEVRPLSEATLVPQNGEALYREFAVKQFRALSANRPKKRSQLDATDRKSRIAILARRLLVSFDLRVFCQCFDAAVGASAV
jgi:hypothetical protein